MKLIGVTAPYTGSGKTLVTLGLLSALENSMSFKIGPDFIDGMVHSAVSGKKSASIDRWLQGRKYIDIASEYGSEYAFGIVEGVMGMFDSGSQLNLSTDYYFRKLNIPYLLVVNVEKMAESAYHVAKGFIRQNCLGIVINNFYSEKHLEMVEREFMSHDIRVMGRIPHSDGLSVPERHLGINTEISSEHVRSISEKVAGFLDIPAITAVRETPLAGKRKHQASENYNLNIWVALDRAFNFYYETSMDALYRMGKVHFFSPLNNEVPENPDLIYIGGGYPELFPEQLSRNEKTRTAILNESEYGTPIIAECGGLMYLEDHIETAEGKLKMTGVFDGTVHRNSKLTLNYTKLKATAASLLFSKGQVVFGHEFHYSSITDDSEKTLKNLEGMGINGMDGLQVRNTFGSYSHFDLQRYSKRLLKRLLSVRDHR